MSSPRCFFKAPRNRKKKSLSGIKHLIKIGRWERWEKRAFLEGLRKYGQGKWKKISDLIPTRTPVQVKTHAQQILRKIASGETTVFELLESDDSTVTSLTSEATDWTSVVPTKTLHMTPDNKDVDAANILADLHLVLCLRC